MAEEDQFDIDIYGDDGNQDYAQEGQTETTDTATDADTMTDATQTNTPTNGALKEDTTMQNDKYANGGQQPAHSATQQIASTGESGGSQVQVPKQAPIQQGTKRKEGADDRPLDPGATSALLLLELHWWTTEDDIRGWANQAECEDELKDITFNEHKVNGKSKGQVYVEMASAQAATALKHKIDSFSDGQQHVRKPTIQYNPPHINPYKTLPKDVPNRKDYNKQDNRSTPGSFGQNKYNNAGGFQGRGGGGFNNNRGGAMNNFQSRNFTPPAGMNQGGFNNNMPAFNNGMGGGNFGGGFNRGGMMGGGGMRGGMQNNRGRGGMGGNMMGGMGGMGGNMMGGMPGMNMGMGGMPMGGMGGNMGMGMGGMGGGFGGGQGHFNPAFFNGGGQQQGGGADNWNPHGNKRPRPE